MATLQTAAGGGEDHVSLYLLAYRHLPGNRGLGEHNGSRLQEFKQLYLSLLLSVPVTLVVTDDSLLLGRENFQQWPLPRLQKLPPCESLKPPFSDVRQKEITDIEQIVS